MKLHSQQEIKLYATYLNFGLTRLGAYQAVLTVRIARRMMEVKP
jgi:hypothetical protein